MLSLSARAMRWPDPLRRKRAVRVAYVAAVFVLVVGGMYCHLHTAPVSDLSAEFLGSSMTGLSRASICEKKEGIIDVCQDLIQEGPCPFLLSQRVMVFISIYGGLFGLDQLYARNLQLFFPKIFLSLVLIPWSWKRLLASISKPDFYESIPNLRRPALSPRSLSSPLTSQDHLDAVRSISSLRSQLINEEKEEEIDKVQAFDFTKLAMFAMILVLSHVWWAVDVILWSFDYYTTGLNGAWFGNPVLQCPLKKSW